MQMSKQVQDVAYLNVEKFLLKPFVLNPALIVDISTWLNAFDNGLFLKGSEPLHECFSRSLLTKIKNFQRKKKKNQSLV